MNSSDIVRLLNSNHYSPADLEEVDKLCRDFPEFSTAHLLKVRILEALGHEKQAQLKVAAVYSMNRKKLLQLVSEVERIPEVETEQPPEEQTEIIQFSEESNEHADVIIEQHAPYAGQEPAGDLLELDEEVEEEPVAEESPEEVSDEPAEEVSEEPAEEVSDDQAEEVSEEPAEEVSEEPAEEVSDDPAEEVLDDPAEEVSDDPAEEVSDDPAEAVLDDPAEEKLDADVLISSLEKDETEMEEPESSEDEIPVIDQVDHVKEKSSTQLISSFIKDEPGPIRADKKTTLKGDVSLASIREHDGFITDTLAQIYVKQGLYAKAIYAYEKLSLKYPEKSAYFAAQIEKIRNINH